MILFTLPILLVNVVLVQTFSYPSITTFSSIANGSIIGGRPFISSSTSISINSKSNSYTNKNRWINTLFMSENKNDGVVELAEDDENATPTTTAPVASTNGAAPFLSQGDIAKEALEFSNDPKQTRVIIYIILSLIPVLFLVPLMLGSRDLIPLDALPPVELN